MRSSRKTVRKTSGIASRALQRQNKPITPTTPLHPLLGLQQAIGNQAVGQLIQAKLNVGRPGDRFEQEADRVADQVLRMPEPRVQRQADEADENKEVLQAKALAGQTTPLIQRQVEDEAEEEEETVQTRSFPGQTAGLIKRQMEDEEEESIQRKLISPSQSLLQRQEEPEEDEEGALERKETSGRTPKVTPGIAASMNTLRGGGQPLPGSTRAYFESRFGYDFGGVRVHSGTRAADSARAINARAFTVGQDVVFGAGEYAPETGAGRRLLAHELTHVLQQGFAQSVEHDRPGAVIGKARLPLALNARQAHAQNPDDRTLQRKAGSQRQQGAHARQPAPGVPRIFRIVLSNVSIVGHTRVVEAVIRGAIEPLARLAGRQLRFGRRQPGDLTLNFSPGGRESRPCGFNILGNAGGGDILVGAHKDIRVCGIPRRDPRDPSSIDYISQIVRIFDEDEPAFARAVANTAVHELGHMIANLNHTSSRANYMYSVPGIGARLPRRLRTLETTRRHWAGPKSFGSGQEASLVSAIRRGQYTGTMQIQIQPATPRGTP